MSPAVAALLEQLRKALAELPCQELPGAIGELEALKATLWAALTNGAPEGAGAEADQLLDVRQAAAKLHVSADWLYRRAGTLPFTVRPSPGRLRFSTRGIERWIRQRQGR